GDVVMFIENGLTFEADPRRGQKTGHFLDQRDNRLRLRSLCPASKVLDVFACTGGFGVNAALGGARLVHSVNSSAHALAACRRNMAHNRGEAAVRRCRHITTVGDAFATMAHLAEGHERYDVVVLDPPSFASRRTEAAGALRAYAGLTRLALRLLEPGGALVQASCSSQVGESDFFSAVHAAAGECSVRLVELERTGAPFDHPVTFLEGSYLKAMFARVQPDRKLQGG
ncbi:MAG: class I SAM-dependent rRNA methyltransferase, partial [Acidimicrobiales bacterium]